MYFLGGNLKNYIKIILILTAGFYLMLFQNCAQTNFSSSSPLNLASVDGAETTCLEEDLECTADDPGTFQPINNIDEAMDERNTNPNPNPNQNGNTNSNPNATPPNNPQNPSERLVNVVDGRGKPYCDQTVQAAFGAGFECSMGGGCGISCGKPDANCSSANPSHYGACIDMNNPQPNASQTPPANRYVNVVDGRGKAYCDQTVKSRYGANYQCSYGGGCGISCGAPGPNCNSANPQHYGACIDLDNPPPAAAPTPTPPANRYVNVVDGRGKAACDQTVKSRYGANYQCSLGGGCGLSCGAPGPNCNSANPQHYGACINLNAL